MIEPKIRPDIPGTRPGDVGNGHVLVVDAKHQKFNGKVYFRKPSGNYVHKKNGKAHSLHNAVYEFHNGKVPEGYVIHHIHRKPDGSFDKDENNIEYLRLMTPSEHATYHIENRPLKEKVCAWCGETFTTTAYFKKYCSDKCAADYKSYKRRLRETERAQQTNALIPIMTNTVKDNEYDVLIRVCPFCLTPFKVKTNSRVVVCNNPKCITMAARFIQAKSSVDNDFKRTSGLHLFDNKKLGVKIRGLLIDGEAWFVAKDVCDALDIKNSRKAVARLKDDEKDVTIGNTLGGSQKMNIINEFGLYRLILTSRKPEAEIFRCWIIREVLPRLRKMSMYLSTEPMPALEAPTVDVPAALEEPAQLTLDIEPVQSK